MGCIGCMTGIRVMYFDQNFETEMENGSDGTVLNVIRRNGDQVKIDISFCPWCGRDLRMAGRSERRRKVVDGDFRQADDRQTKEVKLS